MSLRYANLSDRRARVHSRWRLPQLQDRVVQLLNNKENLHRRGNSIETWMVSEKANAGMPIVGTTAQFMYAVAIKLDGYADFSSHLHIMPNNMTISGSPMNLQAKFCAYRFR